MLIFSVVSPMARLIVRPPMLECTDRREPKVPNYP